MQATLAALRDMETTDDLLGWLENESTAPCRTVETPYGTVSILPAETAIVEPPAAVRRQRSSSDRRLHAVFEGERGPAVGR